MNNVCMYYFIYIFLIIDFKNYINLNSTTYLTKNIFILIGTINIVRYKKGTYVYLPQQS